MDKYSEVFKKRHVDNKVLEKLFHENNNTTKVVAGRRHTEITKTLLTELSNRIKVISTMGEIL